MTTTAAAQAPAPSVPQADQAATGTPGTGPALAAAQGSAAVIGSITANGKGGKVRKVKDDQEFKKFVRRILRAYRRRIIATDASVLADLVELRAEVDLAIAEAARGLNAGNPELGLPSLSWATIGQELGITKAAAYQRYAK